VKRGCREEGGHHVVGVRVHAAVSSEGDDNGRTQSPYPRYEFLARFFERDSGRLSVVIIKQFMRGDAEYLAGGGKLRAADAAQLSGGRGVAAMLCCLAVGQADDMRLDPAVGCKRKCTTKGVTLIVRVRHDAH